MKATDGNGSTLSNSRTGMRMFAKEVRGVNLAREVDTLRVIKDERGIMKVM